MFAAGEAFQFYRSEELFERAAALAPYFGNEVHRLADAPHVIDIRNLGLVAGIELAPRPGESGKRAMEVFHHCFDNGVRDGVTGEIIVLSPQLIIDHAQIDRIVDQIRSSLAAMR